MLRLCIVNSATAGSLDGWGGRELKVLPASARTLSSKVEENGVWPEGLLDAHMAMIPKTDGDATLTWASGHTFFGASASMGQLEDWFQSWVPGSVFSAGGGRSSVEVSVHYCA